MRYLLDTNTCIEYINNDLLIAAIAVASGLTLVTHNTGEFSRVAGLPLEDWEVGP